MAVRAATENTSDRNYPHAGLGTRDAVSTFYRVGDNFWNDELPL